MESAYAYPPRMGERYRILGLDLVEPSRCSGHRSCAKKKGKRALLPHFPYMNLFCTL